MIIPLDIGHFLLVVFRIKPLSPAFFEILGPKDNWVTTLTFLGHVTIRLPVPDFILVLHCDQDSIFNIFFTYLAPKCLSYSVQCKSSLRMRDITWPVPLGKIWEHIWISHPHIAYSLLHFYWAPMKIKGCLLVRPPMLNAKSSKNFQPKLGKFWRFWGSGGQGLQKVAIFTPKGTCSWIHVVWAILRQNRSGGVTSRSVGEKPTKSQRLP